MGLGSGSGTAVWGQGLDFSVALRPDAEEALTDDCVSAEVQIGERIVTPSRLRVQLERLNPHVVRLRVQTQVALDEPVVVVHLTATCGHAVVRRYVLFVDPPAPAAVGGVPAAASGSSPPDVDATQAPPRPPLPSGSAAVRAASKPAEDDAVAVPASSWRKVALRQPGAVARRAFLPEWPASTQVQQRAWADPRVVPGRLRPIASGSSRLRLDVLAPQIRTDGAVEQALQAVAQAAAAARQSASAASTAADRIARLERTVEQLRAEAGHNRAQAESLSAQLAQAGSLSSSLSWLLGAVAAGFAGLALWLWRRPGRAGLPARAASRADREPQGRTSGGLDAAGRIPTQAVAVQPSEGEVPQTTAARLRPAPAWPPAAPSDGWVPSQSPTEPGEQPAADPEPPTVITAVQPAPASETDLAGREVSIDELLDLEQQAEFFVVLGQDDAAIDLLTEHLQHTGGSSPLPYLKLLEIHRRRGDLNGYERMRVRFNHRFNAYAPEWNVDLQSGRLLTDYPAVLTRLQKVWSRPLESMAELEKLTFRTAGGDMFDLPAYREVLLLYALARDLQDHESSYSGSVDLLLPLTDTGEFSNTAPAALQGDPSDGHTGSGHFQDQPTAPIDLDLTFDNHRPASIFDQMDGLPSPTKGP